MWATSCGGRGRGGGVGSMCARAAWQYGRGSVCNGSGCPFGAGEAVVGRLGVGAACGGHWMVASVVGRQRPWPPPACIVWWAQVKESHAASPIAVSPRTPCMALLHMRPPQGRCLPCGRGDSGSALPFPPHAPLHPLCPSHPSHTRCPSLHTHASRPINARAHTRTLPYARADTAKIAGTEVGVREPEATFSACFGAAFLM